MQIFTSLLLRSVNGTNSTNEDHDDYENQVYEAHTAAALVIFSILVISGVGLLYCFRNYMRYLLMCRTDDKASKIASGEWTPPMAVRIRDSGTPGTILRSIDSGLSWTEVKLPSECKIVAAKAPTPDAMYVLDSDGKAYKSIDFGEEWFQDDTVNENNVNEL